MLQIINSDAPEIEITEPEIINEIPQSILDSEIVESIQPDSINNGSILQNDGDGQANLASMESGGGGTHGPFSAIILLLISFISRRRFST